jgi:hypothetical protein
MRPVVTMTTTATYALDQIDQARTKLSPPTWATGPTAATDPFTQMIKAWTEAFTRFSGERTTDPRSS